MHLFKLVNTILKSQPIHVLIFSGKSMHYDTILSIMSDCVRGRIQSKTSGQNLIARYRPIQMIHV